MDPNATYEAMLQAVREGNHDMARLYAIDLRDWQRKGGFAPYVGWGIANDVIDTILA
jgi:hypothetical protein